MKIVGIAFTVLLFSIAMSFVTHSQIFTASTYYESEIGTTYEEGIPENLTAITEEYQYPTTMNILGVIFSGVTFTWIANYAPEPLQEGISQAILGLDIIIAFIVGVALIEIWTKRSDVLQ